MPCSSVSELLPLAFVMVAERHTDCVTHAFSVQLPQEAGSVLVGRHRLFVFSSMR